ncbi:MAG: cytochrome c [Flavobacteriales bacterium]|nr:cytochrome c [Flavobacteriales bacterium]
MKHLFKAVLFSLPILLASCGGDDSSKKEIKDPIKKVEKKAEAAKETSGPSYGIGPIAKGDVTLADEVDTEMAEKGKDVYMKMCTACHKPEKKFIGPAPKGVLSRRTPEWIMNMILNPEQMVKEDATARKLLMEYNGAPMANQNLTEEQARQVLEYFRTL